MEALLSSIAPFQIALVRHPADADVGPYEDAIIRAFQGGKEAGAYLATGDDLGIQMEVFASTPPLATTSFANSFSHSLVVVFVDHKLLSEATASLWDWLQDFWSHVKTSNERHGMLVVAMDERAGAAFSKLRPEFEEIQLLHVHQLGERAIRPATLALRVIHISRVLLAKGLWPNRADAGHLRLFISHAKIDGLPLAHALKHQIAQLKWLSSFYDADDIPPGSAWQRELEKGVGSSLIVILRTESYDGRAWCQQEVFWADEFATPAVLVDARTNLNHPAGILPLDRVPSVRIPDGNLYRILYLCLREGLKFLLFMRRVETLKDNGSIPSPVELRTFCFQPSMSALLRACQSLLKSSAPASVPRWILYPDPPFRAGTFEAAQALVNVSVPNARLVTPQTIAATGGGAP